MSNSPRRAAITGAGIITGLGSEIETVLDRLHRGATAVDVVKRFSTQHYGLCHGATLDDDDPTTIALRWAVEASRVALAQAGWKSSSLPRDFALVCGTTAGESERVKHAIRIAAEQPGPQPCLTDLLWYRPDVLTRALCHELGVHGYRITLSNACATGIYAIDHAIDLLNSGVAPAVLVCAVDIFNEFNLSALRALRLIARQHLRPFDIDRTGTLLGDGAGALVLERDLPTTRPVFSYVHGVAVSCEAFDLAGHKADGSGMAATMNAALRAAQLDANDIAYLNAHGTGTPRNDESELQAIEQVFTDSNGPLVIGSTKAATGHTGAASGIVETIITAAAATRGIAPPTLFYTQRDSQATVGLIASEPVPLATPFAMSNSFGFGGANGTVIVSSRPPEPRPTAEPRPLPRVVITGLGSCLSQPYHASATAPIDPDQMQLDLHGFRPQHRFFGAGAFSMAALAAATRALDSAKLARENLRPDRLGVSLGTCYGSSTTNYEVYRSLGAGNPKYITPLISVNSGFNAAGDALAVEFGAEAFSLTITEGELSSLHAIALAADRVRTDRADIVLSAGSDVLVSPFVDATQAQRNMSDRPWRLLSGAVCMIVESEASACQRNAVPLFEIQVWRYFEHGPDRSVEASYAELIQYLEDHQCGLDQISLIVSYCALPDAARATYQAALETLAHTAGAPWHALDQEVDQCGGLAAVLAVAQAGQWSTAGAEPGYVLICATDMFDQSGILLLRHYHGGPLDDRSSAA